MPRPPCPQVRLLLLAYGHRRSLQRQLGDSFAANYASANEPRTGGDGDRRHVDDDALRRLAAAAPPRKRPTHGLRQTPPSAQDAATDALTIDDEMRPTTTGTGVPAPATSASTHTLDGVLINGRDVIGMPRDVAEAILAVDSGPARESLLQVREPVLALRMLRARQAGPPAHAIADLPTPPPPPPCPHWHRSGRTQRACLMNIWTSGPTARAARVLERRACVASLWALPGQPPPRQPMA